MRRAAHVYKVGPGDYRVRVRTTDDRWVDMGGVFPTREVAESYLALLQEF